MTPIIRMSVLSVLITPIVVTLSCSHMAARKEALSPKQENWLEMYLHAKKSEKSDTPQSCALFTKLGKESDFPLKDLARIRSHLVCPHPQTLDPIPEDLGDSQPWLADLDLKRQIEEAEKAQDRRKLAQAQWKKAQKTSVLRDKIQWLERALENSQKIETPTGEDLALQTEIQGRLFKASPRRLPDPLPQDYFAVANDWFLARDFDKGRDFLKKITDGKTYSLEEQYQARRALRNSYKTEQKKSEHIAEAGRLAIWTRKKASPQRINEAYVTWARAEWTLGNTTSAQKILIEAEKILNKKFPLDEVYFIRARMAEERQDHEEALQFLTQAEKETRNHRALRDRILFLQAWIQRKMKKFDEASQALAKLKTETLDPFDKNRYMFWLARSLKQAGRNEDSQKELQELTQNDPLGYYGLVAYREMNSEIPALPIARKMADDESRPVSVSVENFRMIRALATVEENEVLEKFLDLRAAELNRAGQQDLATWLFYLKSYAKAGLYNPLFQQVGSLSAEMKASLLAQEPELLFPRNYLDLITASAEKFGVRPELMLSIIRQESAFNPNARSGADAFGLMQVIPSVAHQHAKDTGISLQHFEDLYKPEINIPVGAALLADLGKKYRGQFVLTAAAYNANERAIESWLKTRLKEDPLEFIEDIPYEETKSYVKLVLRNFIFYSRLANPGKTLAFPNWCLDDLQSFKVSTR